MRVGLFVGNIRPTEGGGFTFVENFLELLRPHARGAHEFVVCHLGQPGSSRLAEGFAGLDVAAGAHSALSARERAPLARVLNRISPQAQTLDPHARVYRAAGIELLVLLSPWALSSLDVPFASFVWDVQHRNNPWFPEVSELGGWDARERLLASQAQRAALVFTGTERGAEEIHDFFRTPRERICLLPFPVPEFAARAATAPAHAELLRPLRLPERYFLYPAQFWAHKNHVTLLHALRRLKDRQADAPGVVFTGGDQGNQDHVREQAEALGLAGSVRFLGFVQQDVLIQLYRSAVALAFPTYCGPDNLPPLEAFALGCPVVASNVPGAQEQLGDAALFFDPSDDAALASHLSAVANDVALRAALVARGRERAGQRTGARCAQGFLDALDGFARIRRAWKH